MASQQVPPMTGYDCLSPDPIKVPFKFTLVSIVYKVRETRDRNIIHQPPNFAVITRMLFASTSGEWKTSPLPLVYVHDREGKPIEYV